jgi:hypothetical protein
MLRGENPKERDHMGDLSIDNVNTTSSLCLITHYAKKMSGEQLPRETALVRPHEEEIAREWLPMQWGLSVGFL